MKKIILVVFVLILSLTQSFSEGVLVKEYKTKDTTLVRVQDSLSVTKIEVFDSPKNFFYGFKKENCKNYYCIKVEKDSVVYLESKTKESEFVLKENCFTINGNDYRIDKKENRVEKEMALTLKDCICKKLMGYK